jgi:eukaryotic-like serine/threonine-protein kinase
MTIAPGTQLGPYEVLALRGAGGMGEVYRARDTRLDRTVAIKVLSPAPSDSPDRRARFQREARAISALSHPHICALYDVGHQDGTDFLVMEYLEGKTLAERLERGPLPRDALFGYAVQIADALDQAHERGIAHRDLKPANIMLTPTGAKLLDFGIAKAVSRAADVVSQRDAITEDHVWVGSYPYMSPEQLHGQPADARSDIFAFGAVLYEMVTGKRAFPGESPFAVASAILEKEPPDLSALRPPLFERVVGLCLAKDPAARWQSARDLRRQLEWIRDGISGEAAPGPPKRGRAIGWAVALATVALLAGLVMGRGRTPATGPGLPLQRTSILPPPGVSFEPFHFALSPDGTRLAFVGIGQDGQTSLWARSLDTRVAKELSETANGGRPFWAPDSRRVAFFADGKLKVVETGSGAVRVLCDAPAGRGGSWSREGTIVFSPFFGGPLLSVSERGGAPKPATTADPETGKAHRWPFFLPDGRHFLYFEDWGIPGGPRPNGIYVGSVDGGDAKLVSADLSGSVFYASGHLLYLQDGSLVAQPFDAARLELTGSPVNVFDRELEKDEAFSRANVSLSENGAAAFQSLSDAASEMVWFDRAAGWCPALRASSSRRASSPPGSCCSSTRWPPTATASS